MLQRSPTKKRWPLFLLFGYTCLLLWGTHTPSEPLPSFFSTQDKLIHVGAYAVLAFLVFLTAITRDWFSTSVAVSAVGPALIVILATGTFGAVDELTQSFVGRRVDILDWVADLVGGIAGATVFAWLVGRKWNLIARIT
jgi:VanZ family protein